MDLNTIREQPGEEVTDMDMSDRKFMRDSDLGSVMDGSKADINTFRDKQE